MKFRLFIIIIKKKVFALHISFPSFFLNPPLNQINGGFVYLLYKNGQEMGKRWKPNISQKKCMVKNLKYQDK